MKGIIARAVPVACLLSGLVVLTGCYGYRDLVDPCYPWRYNSQAQEAVCEPLSIQVNNGHILDQTLWNHYFETTRDKVTNKELQRLNGAGRDKLDQIIRRRPHMDSSIYVAAAHDVGGESTDDIVRRRQERDRERKAAVEEYVRAVTGNAPQVVVHDPSRPSMVGGGVTGGIPQQQPGGLQRMMRNMSQSYEGTGSGSVGVATP
jgi:hypothetical protein